MYITNVQLLSDKDYAKAIPNDYVINAKSVQMTKAVIQVAKRLESDKSKVYHINTEKFAETHPDAVESTVAYLTDPNTGHVDLIAAANPMPNMTDTITAITGRMLHRTQSLAARLEAEQRKSRRAAKKTEDAPADSDASNEVTEESGVESEAVSNETESTEN